MAKQTDEEIKSEKVDVEAPAKVHADKESPYDKAAAAQVEKDKNKKAEAVKAAEKQQSDLAKKLQHTHVVEADAITSKRGVLVKGATCKSQDFPGDDEQLAEMVSKKLIKKL